MGIGRREFLGLFGGLLAKLARVSSPAAACVGEVYLNRRLGIAFSCPPGWKFVSVADMGALREGQLLALDEQVTREIWESTDLPFVGLMPDCQGDSSVGIQFYLVEPPPERDVVTDLLRAVFTEMSGKEVKESVELQYPVPMQIIRSDWQALRGVLHALRVSSLPENIEISNCQGAEYTTSFDFQHRDLPAPRRVRMRTIVVQHDARCYLLRLSDTEQDPFDFAPFLASLRLV